VSAPVGQAAAAPAGIAVIREVAGDRVSQVVFAAVTLVAGLLYSVLMPFDFTLQFSLANWQFFTPRDAFFASALALGLAWVVTVQVYAMRRIVRRAAGRPRRGGLAGAVAAVISLLPGFLCCSPIVPTAVSLLGLPAATQLSMTGNITYFFAVYQNWLLAGALALLVVSGAWSARKVARAACLRDSCPAPGAGTAGAGAGEPRAAPARGRPR
jgi:hypothetical protein